MGVREASCVVRSAILLAILLVSPALGNGERIPQAVAEAARRLSEHTRVWLCGTPPQLQNVDHRKTDRGVDIWEVPYAQRGTTVGSATFTESGDLVSFGTYAWLYLEPFLDGTWLQPEPSDEAVLDTVRKFLDDYTPAWVPADTRREIELERRSGREATVRVKVREGEFTLGTHDVVVLMPRLVVCSLHGGWKRPLERPPTVDKASAIRLSEDAVRQRQGTVVDGEAYLEESDSKPFPVLWEVVLRVRYKDRPDNTMLQSATVDPYNGQVKLGAVWPLPSEPAIRHKRVLALPRDEQIRWSYSGTAVFLGSTKRPGRYPFWMRDDRRTTLCKYDLRDRTLQCVAAEFLGGVQVYAPLPGDKVLILKDHLRMLSLQDASMVGVERFKAFPGYPAACPDGTKAACMAEMTLGDADIILFDLDASKPAHAEWYRVAYLPGDDFLPAFSSDGKQLAFYHRPASREQVKGALDAVRKSSRAEEPSRKEYARALEAALPDAPEEEPTTWCELYLAELDGFNAKSVRKVCRIPGVPDMLSWFPGDKEVLVSLARDGLAAQRELLRVNIATGEQAALQLPELRDPDWGCVLRIKECSIDPTGKRLAFLSELRLETEEEIKTTQRAYICDLDGSNLIPLTPLDGTPIEEYVYPATGKKVLDVAAERAKEEILARNKGG